MIASDEETLRARLMKRWSDLDYSEAEATRKVGANDLLNARHVMQRSGPAEFILA